MSAIKKLITGAAGAAGALPAGPDIDEMFEVQKYEGTGASGNQITTSADIDMSNDGGMVWIKNSDGSSYPFQWTASDDSLSNARNPNTAGVGVGVTTFGFNTNGITVNTGNGRWNTNGGLYHCYLWKKQEKFFTTIAYTGNQTANRAIAHDLGSVPGMIIVKRTDSTGSWRVYHRGINAGVNPEDWELKLEQTSAAIENDTWSNTAPTSTHFYVSDGNDVNANGSTFIAYIFAHNDGDTEFGPKGNEDFIKCGHYIGNGSNDGPEIDLGFEPQLVMIRGTERTGADWVLHDNTSGLQSAINSNQSAHFRIQNTTELRIGNYYNLEPKGYGFKIKNSIDNNYNASGEKFIYMAVKRSTKIPTDANKVFDAVAPNVQRYANAKINYGFHNADLHIECRNTGGLGFWWDTALTWKHWSLGSTNGSRLTSRDDGAQYTGMSWSKGNTSDQLAFNGAWDNSSLYIDYMFKRATSFLDIVQYQGGDYTDGGTGFKHSLGVEPELIFTKRIDSSANWGVYLKSLGNSKLFYLDTTSAPFTVNNYWGTISDTSFNGGVNGLVNGASGAEYMAYLWASCAGVSKIGTYTGDGTSAQIIDCGFSSGSQFVMIKSIDSAGSWGVWDSVRGINAGTDPYLFMNNTDAPITSLDVIDPNNSGFEVVDSTYWNASGNQFMFMAIAA